MKNLATRVIVGYPPPNDITTEHVETDMHHSRRRPLSDSEATQETVMRARRIETRLTSLLVALGHDTEAQKPKFQPADGSLQLPSPHASLKECLSAVPEGWTNDIKLFIGKELVGVLRRS